MIKLGNFKLFYNRESASVVLLRNAKCFKESYNNKSGKMIKEDMRSTDDIKDWEKKNRINYQSNYSQPTRDKTNQSYVRESKQIKESVKNFLESEKISCDLSDIYVVKKETFDSMINGKNKVTFLENVREPISSSRMSIGIINDEKVIVAIR
jgi:predicted RND superfamily exporter protein